MWGHTAHTWTELSQDVLPYRLPPPPPIPVLQSRVRNSVCVRILKSWLNWFYWMKRKPHVRAPIESNMGHTPAKSHACFQIHHRVRVYLKIQPKLTCRTQSWLQQSYDCLCTNNQLDKYQFSKQYQNNFSCIIILIEEKDEKMSIHNF